jgi:hypothetical protein
VRDFEVERQVAGDLRRAGPQVLSLAEDRVASPDVPVALALAHAQALVAAGRTDPPVALVERAFASPDGADHLALAALAAQAGWSSVRPELQRAWERDRSAHLAEVLAAWDESSGEAARLHTALDLCEAHRTPALRAVAVRLATNDDREVARRAEGLLRDWPQR